jgi:CubicO group peptidase (beta-lactamase class C family)
MTPVRSFALISLLTLALLGLRPSATAASEDEPIANLDAFITRALKEYQVPGAAVAVVQNGRGVLLKGYGVRDVTKPGAVDENTIFQLASVTKTLTGAAAGTVVDEGKLDWDKPIFNYLPDCDALDFLSRDTVSAKWHSIPIRDSLSPVKLRGVRQGNHGTIWSESVCSLLWECRGLVR